MNIKIIIFYNHAYVICIHNNDNLIIFIINVKSSSKLTTSEIIISNMQATSSTLLDPEINKNKCISIEENARLNSTYSLYLEFVHTHCDEIIKIDKNIYPNNGLFKFWILNFIIF